MWYTRLQPLHRVHRSVVTADIPRMYGDRVRAHAQADATVLNLNDLCPFFFLFGRRLVSL
jgi:hypothetical protein